MPPSISDDTTTERPRSDETEAGEGSPFRAHALAALRRPEQLDDALTTRDPAAWAIVLALVVAVLAGAVWAVVATVPEHRSLTGVVVREGALASATAPIDGEVSEVSVRPGDRVGTGGPIVTLDGDDGSRVVTSSLDGVVQEITVATGDVVGAGARLAVVLDDRSDAAPTVAAFLDAEAADAIEAGTDVRVRTGGGTIDGAATFVAAIPTDREGVVAALGTAALADEAVADADGAPHLVIVSIDEAPATLVDGRVVEIEITVARNRPIDLLLGR